uniref:Uncharacterized protein n=1 Tax=Megaselia scalaris TaxID=36166 RepID=T1GNK9_MEGSC
MKLIDRGSLFYIRSYAPGKAIVHPSTIRGTVYSGGSCDVFTQLINAKGKDVLYESVLILAVSFPSDFKQRRDVSQENTPPKSALDSNIDIIDATLDVVLHIRLMWSVAPNLNGQVDIACPWRKV